MNEFVTVKADPRFEINRNGVIRNVKTGRLKGSYISSSTGMSQDKIAKAIGGISRSTVLKIKLGQMWTGETF